MWHQPARGAELSPAQSLLPTPLLYTLHNNPDRLSLLPEKFGRLGSNSDKKPAAVTNYISKTKHPGHIPILKLLQLQEQPALALHQLPGAQLVTYPWQ